MYIQKNERLFFKLAHFSKKSPKNHSQVIEGLSYYSSNSRTAIFRGLSFFSTTLPFLLINRSLAG